MISGNSALKKDEGNKRVPPDILHAAAVGDINEGLAAIREDKNCIEKVNGYYQNALQIALLNFHEDFAHFLLNETDITVIQKDALDRDALDIALFGASEEMATKINDRWYDEHQANDANDIDAPEA